MGMAVPWATITAIPMRDADLLTLTQWLSPAYPVGAFAWSHGLEQAVTRGDVSGPDDLAEWLQSVLEHGAGRTDAILLVEAYRADDVVEIAELAAALAPSRERRMETMQQGAAFAATTRAVWGLDVPDMAFPVAVGRAASLAGLPLVAITQGWLQAFLSNLVQAAQRLMPIGQTDAQRVLVALQPDMVRVARETRGLTNDDIYSNAFLSDIAAMRHETLEPRLFQS